MKVVKNDVAFKELNEYAKSTNLPLKNVLGSDEHLEKVCEIFYQHMPKMVKFTMTKDKFKIFYQNNREMFIKNIESMFHNKN